MTNYAKLLNAVSYFVLRFRVKPSNAAARKCERYDNNTCSHLDLFQVRLSPGDKHVIICLHFVDLRASHFGNVTEKTM